MANLVFVSLFFFIVFAGSLHCKGMCGPIAFSIIYYQVGRIFSYIFLLFVFGAMGLGFSIDGVQKIISITLGINMIFSVFLPSNFFFKPVIFNGLFPCVLQLTVAMSSCHIFSVFCPGDITLNVFFR